MPDSLPSALLSPHTGSVAIDTAALDTAAIDTADLAGAHRFAVGIGGARLLGDATALAVTMVLAEVLGGIHIGLDLSVHIAAAPVLWAWFAVHGTATAVALVIFDRLNHYRVRLPAGLESRHVMLAMAVAGTAQGFLHYLAFGAVPGPDLIGHWTVAATLVLVVRGGMRTWLERRGLWRLPVVMVAAGPANEETALMSSLPGLDYDVVATVSPASLALQPEWDYRMEFKRRWGARGAIVALDDSAAARTVTGRLLRQGLLTGAIPVAGADTDASLQPVFALDSGRTMLAPRHRTGNPASRSIKRLLDVVGAGIGVILALTVLAPLMVWLVLAIKADGGPLFFRHSRIGRHGRVFQCLKLRTMAVDADRTLLHAIGADGARAREWQRDFKLRSDPRVTAVGKFLRRTSLDELPQLLNVLRGDMSLVGPRPIVAAEIERYGDDFAWYLRVRPGLTGLWQVSGRNNLDYPTRVRLDASYVRTWTLGQDVAILFRTIPALLTARGAC
jgi:undecaprenyl-phosphate galactose phosphotransferase